MAKLTPESPRLFRPTLAAWIGLNESIFLEQLNFILTEMDDKGRFADGKKWYRDTPRAFMIQYFPFWDESIVKRTIANLRADALILVRSDLNEDHRDRSLWYTINYPALERLDGPVARITGKSDKRKEARKARKSKPDNHPDYAKVQNVLTKSKGTNSTSDSQQNVLLPQVQNVPTPKESLILEDSKPKDSSPYGEGGKPPPIQKIEPKLELTLEQVEESPPNLNPPIPEIQPETPPPETTKPKKVRAPKPPAFEVYTQKTEYYSVTKEWVEKMVQIVGEKPEDLARWGDTITDFTGRGKWKGNVQDMLDWYQNGAPDYSKKGQSTNGHHGAGQTNESLDPALQTTGPPTTAEQLTAAWERKSRGGRDKA